MESQTLTRFRRTLVGVLTVLAAIAWQCASPGPGGGGSSGGSTGTTTTKGYVENQPQVPTPEDDAYFQTKAESQEVFRVLITGENYQFRQVSGHKYLRRKRDDNGDRDSLVGYQKFSKDYNFTDWDFNAMI